MAVQGPASRTFEVGLYGRVQPPRYVLRDIGRGRPGDGGDLPGRPRDRKSTRLNSSHTVISYAVFCLKKKSNDCRRATPDGWPAFRTGHRSGTYADRLRLL